MFVSNFVQNLAVLHGFIKAKFVSLLYKLVILLHLANLPHKFLGLNQRLGQVSSNSENVQNLAVLHDFIKAKYFFPLIQTRSYYYAYKIYHTAPSV